MGTLIFPGGKSLTELHESNTLLLIGEDYVNPINNSSNNNNKDTTDGDTVIIGKKLAAAELMQQGASPAMPHCLLQSPPSKSKLPPRPHPMPHRISICIEGVPITDTIENLQSITNLNSETGSQEPAAMSLAEFGGELPAEKDHANTFGADGQHSFKDNRTCSGLLEVPDFISFSNLDVGTRSGLAPQDVVESPESDITISCESMQATEPACELPLDTQHMKRTGSGLLEIPCAS